MKEQLLSKLDQADALEELYRGNKSEFKTAFNVLYPEIKDHPASNYWQARLNYQSQDLSWGAKNELLLVIVLSLVAGLIAKLPQLTGISDSFFYPRNLGYIVFPFLTFYFAWKNKVPLKKNGSGWCFTPGQHFLY